MSADSELKHRALELYASVTGMEDTFFFPTGGVFLTIGHERLRQLTNGTNKASITDEDLWGVYAQWHEATHMAQLVTCPYACQLGFRLATLARAAFENRSGQYGDGVSLEELREEYVKVSLEISQPATDGYSAWEILETHAVTQGLLWAMPDNVDSLLEVANHLYMDYKRSPDYVRVVNSLARTFDDRVAIKLSPRLCFLALQTNDPTMTLAHLVGRISSERAATHLSDCTPRQFCEWAHVSVSFASKSLRERDTPMRDVGWMRLFDQYFNDFERQSDVDGRLNILMGLHGANTYQMFCPTFTVFSDGDVRLSRGATDTEKEEEIAQWIATTRELVEGLRILNQ
jgi:hypothetical protein